MKFVYISYPYRDNPKKRVKEIKKNLKTLVKEKIIPFVPHLAFIEFEERFGRKYAMKCSVEAVKRCDELWVCSREISKGMKKEIEFAKKHRIPVKFFPLD